MVMCYYHGLGVGHTYVHAPTSTTTGQCATGDSELTEREIDVHEGPDGDSQGVVESAPEVHDSDELASGLVEDEHGEDEDSDGSCSGPSDDEEFYEMTVMYGS